MHREWYKPSHDFELSLVFGFDLVMIIVYVIKISISIQFLFSLKKFDIFGFELDHDQLILN